MANRYQVLIKDRFDSIHSLEGNETPHPHRFCIEVVYSGIPHHGKVLDLLRAKTDLHCIIAPLNGAYLNQFEGVPQEVRDHPTCETLCEFVRLRLVADYLPVYQKHHPELELDQITIELFNENEEIYFGAARWTR